MKKLLFIIFIFFSLQSFCQNTITNHPRFIPSSAGSMNNAAGIFDISPTQTRKVLFQDIEGQFIMDSSSTFPFASYAYVKHIRDSLLGVFPQSAVPLSRTITINGTTFDLSANRSWTITAGVASVFGRTGAVTAQSGDYTFSQIASTPTTLAGYGITDAYPITGGNISNSSNGWIGFQTLTNSPASQANVTVLYRDSAGGYAFRYPSGFIRTLRAINPMTANRTIFWPDSSGTAALKDYSVQYSDTAAMLAAYTRNGSGVVFFYDSTQFKNLGTGVSPFRMTNTITGGSCTNCNLTYDSTGRIFVASSAGGGVGNFLFLPKQVSVVAYPSSTGLNLYDSLGVNWVMTDDGYRRFLQSTLTANRTYTLPDYNEIIGGTNVNNNFTAIQTITNTVGPQLTLAYDGSHSATFSVNSSGVLAIAQTSGSNLSLPNIAPSNITVGSNGLLTLSGTTVVSLGATTGRFTLPSTITAAGTTTAQTINKITGSVNIAAGSSSVVVTNSTVQGTSSLVYLQVYGNDATAKSATVSAVSAGSFTIQLNANATAETKIGFLVIN